MKVKARMQEFLEDIGYKLGYNQDILPKLKDMDIVEKNNIPVWEYMGYRSEKSFYSKRKPSALALKEIIKKYGMDERLHWENKDDKSDSLPKVEEFEDGPPF